MATRIKKKTIRQTKKTSVSPFNIYWEKKNYYFLFLGALVTIVGFYFMSVGSWNSLSSLMISPIILVIAYVIIFPLSIFLRKRTEKVQSQENEIDPGKS